MILRRNLKLWYNENNEEEKMLEKYIKELAEYYKKDIESGISKFVEYSHNILSLIKKEHGEVIYSSKETLRKGKYYFLGLNPGGEGKITNSDGEVVENFIGKHLDNFPKRTSNAFFDEKWDIKIRTKNGDTKGRTYSIGENPLQLRVKYLFNETLKSELRDVFATNLIFKTTNNSESLNFGLAGLCWGVHLLALSIVQPDVIITCGNNQDKSAFFFISDLYNGVVKTHKLKGTFCIKESRITILNRPTLLIGLPHLSLFEIRNNEDFKEKFLRIIGR